MAKGGGAKAGGSTLDVFISTRRRIVPLPSPPVRLWKEHVCPAGSRHGT